MSVLKNIIDLNKLFESDSMLLDKLIFYWIYTVRDELKLKYPKDILKIEHRIHRYIHSIEIDFIINDSFVYAIELNLNVDELPTTENMVDRIIWLYKERNYG